MASVAGLTFDLRVVARAGERDELSALEALEVAAAAGIVQEAGADRYRFAHALVRAALRSELSTSRRIRVHLRIGEALEAVHHDDLEEQAGELAYHFFEATPAAGPERAYRYALLAAQRATRLLAHDEAAAAYGRALDLLGAVKGDDGLTRCELLMAMGEAQDRAGDFNSAVTTFRSAAEEAVTHDTPTSLARAAIAHEAANKPGVFAAEAVELLDQAVAALPAEDSALRALAMACLSRALEFSARREAGVKRGEEALAMARRLDDPRTTAKVLGSATLPGPTSG